MTVANGTKRKLEVALGNHAAAQEVNAILDEADAIFDRVDVVTLTEQVTVTNAVKTDMSTAVPAGAVILSVAGRNDTLIEGDGTGDDGLVRVGLGVAGNPDAYGIGLLTKNVKTGGIPTLAPLGSETTLGVYAADAAGAAVTEKFTAGGKVTISIVYLVPKALPDAP